MVIIFVEDVSVYVEKESMGKRAVRYTELIYVVTTAICVQIISFPGS